ncbi:MAG: SOS response-associated peptidase family protein [Planctomycetota bacterium]
MEAFGAEWGLLPHWWKPSDKQPKRSAFQRKTINARSETAAEKPTFRDAMRKRRCLLPMDEFFERDHYFGVGEPIAFAGLWESWCGEDGEIETVTLLTTTPNSDVRGVGHHRMPVLLTTPDRRRDWIVSGADEEMHEPTQDGKLVVMSK